MALKATIDTLDSVPEPLREFYAEKDGKFHLQAEGLVPKSRLDEFRETNIATKRELDELRAKFDGVDPDKFRELSEKEQKLRDKRLIEAGKLDELLAERVAAMKADYEKKLGMANDQAAALTKQLESLVVDNAIRDAATKAGVRPTAIEDALLRGKQVFRLHDGKALPFDGDKPIYGPQGEPMTMAEWFSGLAERAPHLFEQSTGGGAKGNQGVQAGAKTMTRAQFEALPVDQRASVLKSGTTLTD